MDTESFVTRVLVYVMSYHVLAVRVIKYCSVFVVNGVVWCGMVSRLSSSLTLTSHQKMICFCIYFSLF